MCEWFKERCRGSLAELEVGDSSAHFDGVRLLVLGNFWAA
jgi:hypothetical protein